MTVCTWPSTMRLISEPTAPIQIQGVRRPKRVRERSEEAPMTMLASVATTIEIVELSATIAALFSLSISAIRAGSMTPTAPR